MVHYRQQPNSLLRVQAVVGKVQLLNNVHFTLAGAVSRTTHLVLKKDGPKWIDPDLETEPHH